MRSRIAAILVSATLLLAGHAHAGSIDKKETIKLDRASIVGNAVLQAGSYEIELSADPDKVRFVQGRRTVAEVPVKVGLATVVYPGNAVHYRTAENGEERLIKIVVAKSKLAIEPLVPAGVEADVPIAKTSDR